MPAAFSAVMFLFVAIVAQPAREQRIPVGDASLYARDIGSGQPLIVLHGGPDFDSAYLLPEFDRLADQFHLVYYDQRGRGKSAAQVAQGSEGILKARAVEARLDAETWDREDCDLLPRVRLLNIPTLVLTGDRDFIPADIAQHIAQAVPNARLVTLHDCGHFSYMECGPDVHRVISEFLAKR